MPSSVQSCDVAIVGAGPAGCTAAAALARHGIHTVLLEKAVLPRYKTCGGGLVWRGIKILPPAVERVIEQRFHTATFCLPETHDVFTPQREQPIISMSMRDKLDQVLAEHAQIQGAQLQDQTAVEDLEETQADMILKTGQGRLRARFVIAADGAMSTVARKAGWPDERHLIPALEYELTLREADQVRLAATARFDFVDEQRGYAWIFPKQAHLSVGVLSTHQHPQGLKQALKAYLTAQGAHPALAVKQHGFVIPAAPRRTLARGRLVLTGDAAGLADPLTFEGISSAALSGQWAAQAIIEGALDPPQVRRTYRRLLKPLLRDLKVARLLARTFYGMPRVRRALLRDYGGRFAEHLTDIYMGTRSYRGELTDLENYTDILRHLLPRRRG